MAEKSSFKRETPMEEITAMVVSLIKKMTPTEVDPNAEYLPEDETAEVLLGAFDSLLNELS